MRKICGVEDERTKREKDVYWRKKEEANLYEKDMWSRR